jgi:hypothetical protein
MPNYFDQQKIRWPLILYSFASAKNICGFFFNILFLLGTGKNHRTCLPYGAHGNHR